MSVVKGEQDRATPHNPSQRRAAIDCEYDAATLSATNISLRWANTQDHSYRRSGRTFEKTTIITRLLRFLIPNLHPFPYLPTFRRSRNSRHIPSLTFLSKNIFFVKIRRQLASSHNARHSVLSPAPYCRCAYPPLKSFRSLPCINGAARVVLASTPQLKKLPMHQPSSPQLSSPNFATALQEIKPNNPERKGAWVAASLHTGRCVPPLPTRTNESPLAF